MGLSHVSKSQNFTPKIQPEGRGALDQLNRTICIKLFPMGIQMEENAEVHIENTFNRGNVDRRTGLRAKNMFFAHTIKVA